MINNKINIALVVITASVLTVLMTTTNPQQAGSTGVTVWFINCFVFLYAVTGLLVHFFKNNKPSRQNTRVTALIVAIIGTFLLSLKSLRQLSTSDIVIIIVVVLLLKFLLKRGNDETV